MIQRVLTNVYDKIHMAIESFELGGPLKAMQPNSLALNRDSYSLMWLHRALPSMTLNVSKDGASIMSLGNVFQCFTILIIRNFLCPV